MSGSTPNTSSINGEWVKPKSGKCFDAINPVNEHKLARTAEAGEADVVPP